jgi:hypothetical protein
MYFNAYIRTYITYLNMPAAARADNQVRRRSEHTQSMVEVSHARSHQSMGSLPFESFGHGSCTGPKFLGVIRA